MDEQTIRYTAIAAAMGSGVAIGFLASMQHHGRLVRKTVATVVGMSIRATSLIGSLYIDLAVKHEGVTPEQAMRGLVAKLNENGIEVEAYKVRGGSHVHKA